ncbi:hypothetical protein [Streptomyces sp. NPDC059909]|uniref:hypothetical protein n=1 Tax=Streptomyces sp. NPDC059909 TaxID=3346998 RepID=UPI003665ACBC
MALRTEHLVISQFKKIAAGKVAVLATHNLTCPPAYRSSCSLALAGVTVSTAASTTNRPIARLRTRAPC